MALLQILLLLLYALPSMLLPITSNPLGIEDTPDNLAWAAQSLEHRSGHEGVRKIPKSIFITPNHSDLHGCPNDYKWQDGHCVKIQNFDVNPLALITSQFQSFLDKDQTTIDYDEDYDYENYDSTESTGPFHIPLSVSFDDDQPVSDTVKDGIQSMPFRSDNADWIEKPPQKNPDTSTELNAIESANVLPIASTIVSNDDQRTDDNVANDKDVTRPVQDVNPTTPGNVVVTTPDESSLIFIEGLSTTQKKVLVDTSTNVLENDDEDAISTERGEIPTTKETEVTMIRNRTEETLDKDLQSESLFKDYSLTGTSINVSDGTTENDIEVSTEPLNSVNDKEVNKVISISTPKLSNNPIVVVPTVEQVQIVTPVQHTTTSHSETHDRKKSNSESISPSTTTTYNNELQTAEHLDINESMVNKKLRDSVMKHELNEDAIETIDTNNRFVYTHLDTSSNEPEQATSSTTTQRNLLNQSRFINKSTENNRKNNKIRFPESATNIFSNFKIKFPGPVQHRPTEPLFNRLIPDNIPKKPPESTARPLFSWLPAGASFDFNRNSAAPAFMHFWNKMPLIRDTSVAATHGLPEQARSNSKSPTDSLYNDAPASEVYKVVSSKNYKHDNR